jgi:hypothetical protein
MRSLGDAVFYNMGAGGHNARAGIPRVRQFDPPISLWVNSMASVSGRFSTSPRGTATGGPLVVGLTMEGS